MSLWAEPSTKGVQFPNCSLLLLFLACLPPNILNRSWDPGQNSNGLGDIEDTWWECWVSHLILLGELEPVVGFEALNIVFQVSNGDGRVVSHTYGRWGRHTAGISVSSEQGGRDSPRHVWTCVIMKYSALVAWRQQHMRQRRRRRQEWRTHSGWASGEAREGGVCTTSTRKHVQMSWCRAGTTGLSACQVCLRGTRGFFPRRRGCKLRGVAQWTGRKLGSHHS